MKKLLEEKNQFKGIDALRFYGGDIRERSCDGKLGIESQDAMYGDKNAYRTLNALLFEGIENEEERICKEKHSLNPEFIKRIEETVQIYIDIFTLMKKNSESFVDKTVVTRVERASSIAYYENGFIQSFFSCSKGVFSPTFAQKDGIVLVEMEFDASIPFIDYEEILFKGEYKNFEEREILLPPFLNIKMEEIQLTPSERRKIKDLNHTPPKQKYRMKAIEFPDYRKSILCSEKTIWQEIIDGKQCAAHMLKLMNSKDKEQDYKEYICWKEKLHQYLKIRFSNIWYGGDDV